MSFLLTIYLPCFSYLEKPVKDLLNTWNLKFKLIEALEPEAILLPREKPQFYMKRVLTSIAEKHLEKTPFLTWHSQIFVGRRLIPRAKNEDEARSRLRFLSGKRHHIITGVYFKDSKREIFKGSESSVLFKRLSIEEIDWYLSTQEWLSCPLGIYNPVGFGASLIKFARGEPSNLLAFPSFQIRNIIKGVGLI